MDILLGQVVHFTDSPLRGGTAQVHEAVAIDNGLIHAVGPAATLRAAHPRARVTDYGSDLISAGFIDCHAHFPQTAIIASWGKRLIDWLNRYTFPEEMRLADPAYATTIANRHLDLVTAHGTTSVCTYATIHPHSVDAYFRTAQTRNMRVWAGRTAMDRNAPDGLRDTAETADRDTRHLIDRWHGVDRLSCVITPRFAPTSTPDQLEALGAVWRDHPHCLMQTHLSEQTDEVAWVQSLFPDARDYLDVYERFGLIGPGAVFGHAIHLTPRERARLIESNSGVAHCPTSNTFIGSGLFDMTLARQGLRVGLATDTGGGSSFSMLRTMAAAYEIGQLRGDPLHPSALWWLATGGPAETLRAGHQIGNIAPGMEADLVVVNLSSTPAIAQAHGHASDIWQAAFPTIMMGDDRAIRAVWTNGRQVGLSPRTVT
ncbi:guanine deaminase [Falsirhodobacter halotolerans]|uniref:guanine deaminase n=1 Tax=Falsirhodobacter halotolerans TaxID=1146892 RepID=UPI001FD33769|nr:guanine deaminase [Falsirhodobacter halotolerans]MCJ8138970.1 guanine deaminase [Falsirhodobacter halotolerans]